MFQPLLTSDDKKALQESLKFTSSPKMVRRTSNPTSINGPPGHFEDVDHANKSDHERLLGVVAKLRVENREPEERVAELRMSHLDLEDNFRALCLSNNPKLKRLAKAMGKGDLLFPPPP